MHYYYICGDMAHDLVSPKNKVEELKNRCRSPHETYETLADVIVGCAQMVHDLVNPSSCSIVLK